jgi:hypothetical protein
MLMLALRPSLRLALLLGGLHAGALFCLWLVPLTLWVKLSGSGLLLMSAVHAVFHHALNRGPRSVQALTLDQAGRLEVVMKGNRLAAELVPGAFVTPWLTVLPCRTAKGRVSVLLTPDRVEAESFRRLRLRLRWGRLPARQAPQ